MQIKLDLKLKDELVKWEEEKAGFMTDRSAGEASATIACLKEKLKTTEQELDKAFQKARRVQNLDQKKRRLKSVVGDRTNALPATIADRDETIASQAKEIDGLKRDGQDYVENLEREKNEEVKRIREDAASYAGSLEARLATQDQQTARLENQLASRVRRLEERFAAKEQQIARLGNQLASEWLFHREAMANIPRERERREEALRQVHHNETRQLLVEHLREQHYPDGATIVMDDDVSKLTDGVSMLTLHNRPKMEDHVPWRGKSTAGLPQQTLTCPTLLNKHLRQELAEQRASNETLRQSLAECQPRHENKPPAEVFRARLRDLQARLNQRYVHTQAGGAGSSDARRFHERGRSREAREEEGLVRVREEAEQRLEKTISGLRKDLEASYAKLEKGKNTSQPSLRAAGRTINALKSKEMQTTLAKEAAGTEARSLRAANRTLEVEKESLEETSSRAVAKEKRAPPTPDRWQMRSEHLAAELERVHGRLAECEEFGIGTACALVCTDPELLAGRNSTGASFDQTQRSTWELMGAFLQTATWIRWHSRMYSETTFLHDALVIFKPRDHRSVPRDTDFR
ncbi:hypothetical protein MMC07_003483 [Pseudocyphellaria aurata]|nr:hypothetical protein [Pseudocyphellaria aurata]